MGLPNYATNLALIKKSNNNTVINVVWGYVYDTSWIEEDEDLIDIDKLSVGIGDTYNYTDSHFYHPDGTQVKSVDEENTNNVGALMDEIVSLCDEIIGE